MKIHVATKLILNNDTVKYTCLDHIFFNVLKLCKLNILKNINVFRISECLIC